MADSEGYLSGCTLGRYRVGPLLGRGGMGEVYRADDVELRRAVALKVLPAALVEDADRLARFVQEARTASSLNHPHVVAIYDIGKATPERTPASGTKGQPTHYIAMELVSGETLREAIGTRRLDLKRALEYLAQAADALAAAHAAGVVHRDLKPENMMLAEGGYIKVLDFGLAKLRAEPALVQDAAQAPTLTVTTTPGLLLGTVGYMSPEQAQGRPADHRSDVFSFGCVLYEVTTGSRAFGGRSAIDTLHQIIHSEPPPIATHLAGVPAEMQRIVRKCLAKDAEERYQSMRDLALDLRDLRRQLDSGTVTTTPVAVAPSRRGLLWPAVAVAAVLALAGAAFHFWPVARQSSPTSPISIQRMTGSGNVIDSAISPDAKYLAYVESDGGRQSLWLRQIAGARPIELVAPTGAGAGFWGVTFSRDSTSLYYALKSGAQPIGTLYQVPVLGGLPRTVLTGIDSVVSLSPDGKRLAYLRTAHPEPDSSALMTASTDGSDARVVVLRRAPEFLSPGFFVAPSWSPDGKRISFAVRNRQTLDAGLMTVELEDGRETSLPGRYADATFTAWLPDGSGIVFVARPIGGFGPNNGGQIWLQPYPSGAVRRITNDLVDYRNASISMDGAVLVTVGYDASASIWTAPTDNLSAVRKLGSERYDGLGGVAWTPSGRILYGTALRASRQIWIRNADGSDARELLTEGVNVYPAVSPDGQWIAFFGGQDGQLGIWRAPIDGSNPRLITLTPDASYLKITPDGRHIYFTASMQGPSSSWRVPAEGGPPTLVAQGLDRAAISPDGRMIAGVYRAKPTDGFSLTVLPIDGGPALHQFPGLPVASGTGSVQWTRDGTGIMYTTVERANIWLQRLSGGPPERMTNYSDQVIFRFELSPDGRTLLMARGTQLRDAFLIEHFQP